METELAQKYRTFFEKDLFFEGSNVIENDEWGNARREIVRVYKWIHLLVHTQTVDAARFQSQLPPFVVLYRSDLNFRAFVNVLLTNFETIGQSTLELIHQTTVVTTPIEKRKAAAVAKKSQHEPFRDITPLGVIRLLKHAQKADSLADEYVAPRNNLDKQLVHMVALGKEELTRLNTGHASFLQAQRDLKDVPSERFEKLHRTLSNMATVPSSRIIPLLRVDSLEHVRDELSHTREASLETALEAVKFLEVNRVATYESSARFRSKKLQQRAQKLARKLQQARTDRDVRRINDLEEELQNAHQDLEEAREEAEQLRADGARVEAQNRVLLETVSSEDDVAMFEEVERLSVEVDKKSREASVAKKEAAIVLGQLRKLQQDKDADHAFARQRIIQLERELEELAQDAAMADVAAGVARREAKILNSKLKLATINESWNRLRPYRLQNKKPQQERLSLEPVRLKMADQKLQKARAEIESLQKRHQEETSRKEASMHQRIADLRTAVNGRIKLANAVAQAKIQRANEQIAKLKNKLRSAAPQAQSVIQQNIAENITEIDQLRTGTGTDAEQEQERLRQEIAALEEQYRAERAASDAATRQQSQALERDLEAAIATISELRREQSRASTAAADDITELRRQIEQLLAQRQSPTPSAVLPGPLARVVEQSAGAGGGGASEVPFDSAIRFLTSTGGGASELAAHLKALFEANPDLAEAVRSSLPNYRRELKREIELIKSSTNGTTAVFTYTTRKQELTPAGSGNCPECPACVDGQQQVKKKTLNVPTSSTKIYEVMEYMIEKYKNHPDIEKYKKLFQTISRTYSKERYEDKKQSEPDPEEAVNLLRNSANKAGIQPTEDILEEAVNYIFTEEQRRAKAEKAENIKQRAQRSLLQTEQHELFQGIDMTSLKVSARQGSGSAAQLRALPGAAAASAVSNPFNFVTDPKLKNNLMITAGKLNDENIRMFHNREILNDFILTAIVQFDDALYKDEKISNEVVESILGVGENDVHKLPEPELTIYKLLKGLNKTKFTELVNCAVLPEELKDLRSAFANMTTIDNLFSRLIESSDFVNFMQAVLVVYRAIASEEMLNRFDGSLLPQVLLTKVRSVDKTICEYVIETMYANPDTNKRRSLQNLLPILQPVSILKFDFETVRKGLEVKRNFEPKMTPALQATINRHFTTADDNKDGKLDAPQVLSVVAKLGEKISPEKVNEIIQRVGQVDESGLLDLEAVTRVVRSTISCNEGLILEMTTLKNDSIILLQHLLNETFPRIMSTFAFDPQDSKITQTIMDVMTVVAKTFLASFNIVQARVDKAEAAERRRAAASSPPSSPRSRTTASNAFGQRKLKKNRKNPPPLRVRTRSRMSTKHIRAHKRRP